MEKKATKIKLSKALNKIGALKFGTFKLTSGDTSPYYIDLRLVPSFPEIFKQVCDNYIEIIKTRVGLENFDCIAGIPTAGTSFATIVAHHFKKPLIYIRTSERQHGRKRLIEGVLQSGDRVLLIDDLITKGGSIIRTSEIIRSNGGIVTDVTVLIDRNENGKMELSKKGITLHSYLTMKELSQNLYDANIISLDQLNTIQKRIEIKSQ